MKKFLKSKSKNQENTTRKIELNDTVDKKEKTQTIKNFSDEHKENKIEHKGNKRDKNKNNVHKIKSDKATQRKTKSIELNMGFIILKIIVIALLALLITTLTAKTVMTRIGTKESTSETESDVQSIDDSSDYAITVTEYTGDTLEAECDYEENTTIVYIVDGSTLEQIDCISFENVSESYITPEETGENKIGYTTTNQKIFYSYSSNCTFTLTETEAHYAGLEEDLIWDCPVSFTKLVSYSDPLYLYEVEYYLTGMYLIMYDTVETTASNDGTSGAAITEVAGEYRQVASVGTDWEDATSEYFLSDELIIPYTGLTGYKYCWVNVIINEFDPITYTICFDGNDADDGEMEAIEATYDEEYTLTANAFTRDGYTFTGWNTEADGSGTSYEDGATVSNLTTTDCDEVTLYAQWEMEANYTIISYEDGCLEIDVESIPTGYAYVIDGDTLETVSTIQLGEFDTYLTAEELESNVEDYTYSYDLFCVDKEDKYIEYIDFQVFYVVAENTVDVITENEYDEDPTAENGATNDPDEGDTETHSTSFSEAKGNIRDTGSCLVTMEEQWEDDEITGYTYYGVGFDWASANIWEAATLSSRKLYILYL